jgi:hypothetical protein
MLTIIAFFKEFILNFSFSTVDMIQYSKRFIWEMGEFNFIFYEFSKLNFPATPSTKYCNQILFTN